MLRMLLMVQAKLLKLLVDMLVLVLLLVPGKQLALLMLLMSLAINSPYGSTPIRIVGPVRIVGPPTILWPLLSLTFQSTILYVTWVGGNYRAGVGGWKIGLFELLPFCLEGGWETLL